MIGPGDLVVCVREFERPLGLSVPHVDGIYTVREIRRKVHFVDGTPGEGFRLEEIVNPPVYTPLDGCTEPSFSTLHFRPIRKPSLKLIYQALDEVPTEVWE